MVRAIGWTFARCLVGAAIMLASISPWAQDWSCRGIGATVCTGELSTGRHSCSPVDQVCVDANTFAFDNGQTGCGCYMKCSASSECAGDQQCLRSVGGHCLRIRCNNDDGCESDARCNGATGTCNKIGACTTSSDCGHGLPICVSGTCQALLPGACLSNKDCPTSACDVPQQCDTAANRCVEAGPLPCGGIIGGLCVPTSDTAFRCAVPVCTSDAECAANPCNGTPRCNVRAGRCEGDDPCGPGQVCLSPPPRFNVPAVCKFKYADFVDLGALAGFAWSASSAGFSVDVDPPPPWPGPSGRNFVLTATLKPDKPVSGSPRPGDLRLAIAASDRAMLTDSTLAAGGKPDAVRWTGDGKSGWRWTRVGTQSLIDSVKLTPVGTDGVMRVEIRGRTFAQPKGAQALDLKGLSYAADLAIEWKGPPAFVARSTTAFDQCAPKDTRGRPMSVCVGSPVR